MGNNIVWQKIMDIFLIGFMAGGFTTLILVLLLDDND